MTSKADAKREKMLRELARREGNKQCMTCVGHGGRLPQYACVQFGTFVCTACSGVHREFQFKVKSIGNSLFKDEEVALMHEVGNDAARAQFLAGWYGTENERTCPMVENTKRVPLQNFIRQVFVEERFKGQRAAPAPAAQAPAPQPQVTQHSSFGGFPPPGQQFTQPQQVQTQFQQPQQAQRQFQQPQAPTPAPAFADPFGLGGFVTPAPANAVSQLSAVFGATGPTSATAVVPTHAQNGGFAGGNGGWDAFGNTPPTAVKPPEPQHTHNAFAIPAPARAPAATMVNPAPAPAAVAGDMFGSMQITPPPAAPPAAAATAPVAAAPDMFGSMFGAPAPAAAPDMFGAMTMTPPAAAPTQAQTQAHSVPGDMFGSMNVAPAAAPAVRQMISDDLFSGGQPAVQPGFGGMVGGMMGGAPTQTQPGGVGVTPGGSYSSAQHTYMGQMPAQHASQTAQAQFGQTAQTQQFGQFGNGGAAGMGGMHVGPGMGFNFSTVPSQFGGSVVDPPSSPDPFGDLGASIGVSAPKPKPKPKEPETHAHAGIMGGPAGMMGGQMGGQMGGHMMAGQFAQQPGMNPQQMQQQMGGHMMAGQFAQQPGMNPQQQPPYAKNNPFA